MSSTISTSGAPSGSGVLQANEPVILADGVEKTEEGGDEDREDLLESTSMSRVEIVDMC